MMGPGGGLPFMGFPGMMNSGQNPSAFMNSTPAQSYETYQPPQSFPSFVPPPQPASAFSNSNFSGYQQNVGNPTSYTPAPSSVSNNPPSFSFAGNSSAQQNSYEHGSQFGYTSTNQKEETNSSSTSSYVRNYDLQATDRPNLSSGRESIFSGDNVSSSGNKTDNSNSGSVSKIQVFTGAVSQVQDTFGMINNDVFFQRK